MVLSHVWGLLAYPEKEWKTIRKESCTIGKCYCTHVLLLAAIPPIAGYIGTTQVGWQVVSREVHKLTPESGLWIAGLSYLTILVAVFTIGKLIHWMGQTYGAKQPLSQCIALAAYTATPLYLSGIMLLYPLLWLNLLLGLPVLAYTVYLLYTGVPIMMGIPRERGFLFSTAVLAVGLVTLVAVLAATVILWDIGAGPVFAG
ncbi:MAG: YIP1 family protein [Gammaproteobacteria bacterium]|nr:YIP1 family protein [Gammaproteobacteria bacterium]MDH3371281.1 YIP1 family protein [Gammaproteobacteria bacterium]MDH3407522.1 YIP1 family protein [Gammaproteobacteria bacterium]MDH3563815.1 YIP1 family protein [Gammaproteobacteria bacterium]MDH5487319.1 YIP1 family protein [Gammaproteobacteria bacterium]